MGIVKRAFGLDIWNIGLTNDLDCLMEYGEWGDILWRSDPGPRAFLADPVGTYKDETGKDWVLVEELSHWTNKGRIVSIPLDVGFQSSELRLEIEDLLHLSYPFTVHGPNGVYLFPECGTSGRLRHYAFEQGKWLEKRDEFLEEPAIDPTFWYHDETWYLFYTRADIGPNDTLFLKVAPSLYGPWEAHPDFPRSIGPAGARPAGPLFEWRGRLFRPSQDCSVSYGGGVILNEVNELSTTQYRETVFRRLKQPPGIYNAGLHTFFVCDNCLIIDAKRVYYGIIAPIVKFKNLARRLIRKNSVKLSAARPKKSLMFGNN